MREKEVLEWNGDTTQQVINFQQPASGYLFYSASGICTNCIQFKDEFPIVTLSRRGVF